MIFEREGERDPVFSCARVGIFQFSTFPPKGLYRTHPAWPLRVRTG